MVAIRLRTCDEVWYLVSHEMGRWVGFGLYFYLGKVFDKMIFFGEMFATCEQT